MYEHILKTWINTTNHTCKWQSFRNRPGFANTNSPLESFNARIKTDFFKRVVLSIGGAITKFEAIVTYYSNNAKKFSFSPRFVKKSHELASNLTKRNYKFSANKNSVKYTGVKNQYVIKLNNENAYKNCSCNCIFYMKDAICMHLIGYSWIFNKKHYRIYSNEPREFAIKKKFVDIN